MNTKQIEHAKGIDNIIDVLKPILDKDSELGYFVVLQRFMKDSIKDK